MNRPLFYIFILIITYFISAYLAIKSRTIFHSFVSVLKKTWNITKEWGDIVFSLVVISFFIILVCIWWPLENDESQILIFIATASTLFFQAIIGKWPSNYRSRPIICTEFGFYEPDSHKTTATMGLGNVYVAVPAYFVRFRVRNIGKKTLRNAEVILEEVKKDDALVKNFLPINLQWSLTQPSTSKVDIPQGAFRTIDLLNIQSRVKTAELSVDLERQARNSIGLAPVITTGSKILSERFKKLIGGIRVCGISEPHTFSDILPSGEYFFYLSINSGNAPPLFVKFSIKYDGMWSEDIKDMFSKHLKVKMINFNYERDKVFDK